MRPFKNLFPAAFSCALIFCLGSAGYSAEPKTADELKKATDAFFGNKNWTPFAASFDLYFYQENEKQNACSGALIFDPLRKKLLMDCFDESGQAVFVFKNDDLNFTLYLPGIARAWTGGIFELEYSDEFQSHLHPLDLYRAISPEPFEESQAISANGVYEGMEIEIAKPYGNSRYLARRIILNKHGQVEHETFFTPGGSITTVVIRELFQSMKNKYDTINSIFYFAPQTIVLHPEEGEKTVMNIKKVTLYEAFPDEAWELKLPDEVKAESIAAEQ